jgi:hypothetical protein
MEKQTNIGAHLLPKIGIVPNDRAAGAVNGTGFDRIGYNSCVLTVVTGAISGGSDSQTVAAKIQHSSDDSAYADYTDPSTGAAAAITTISSASSADSVDVNLIGAKKYIRVVLTPAFVGGTTPKIGCGAVVILGGAVKEPA